MVGKNSKAELNFWCLDDQAVSINSGGIGVTQRKIAQLLVMILVAKDWRDLIATYQAIYHAQLFAMFHQIIVHVTNWFHQLYS